MSFLAHDDSLLHPSFQSYQLIQSTSSTDPASSNVHQSLHPLPSAPHASSSSATTRSLSFKEIKDLASTSPLCPSISAKSALYLDANGFLILLRLKRDGARAGEAGTGLYAPLKPNFDLLGRLEDAGNAGASLAALDDDRWLVLGTETGVLSLLTISESAGRATPSSSALPRIVGSLVTLKALERGEDGEHQVVSHRLLHASILHSDATKARVLIQRCLKARSSSSSAPLQRPGLGASVPSVKVDAEAAKHRVSFEVLSFVVPLVEDGTGGEAKDGSKLEWRARGDEGVVEVVPRQGGYSLLAEAPFQIAFADTTPAPGERGGAKSTSPSMSAPRQLSNLPLRPPPPYSWTQVGTQITIVVPLPPHLVSSSFRIHFSPRGLSVGLAPSSSPLDIVGSSARIEEVADEAQEEAARAREAEKRALELHVMERTLESMRRGGWTNKALGGDIVPSESLWTWEVHHRRRRGGSRGEEEEAKVGLLTLFLEKTAAHRWIGLFSRGSASVGSRMHIVQRDEMDFRTDLEEEEEEDDVPETRDPSELLGVLEGLEKYTQDVGASGGAGGGGWGGVEGAPVKRGGAFEGEEEEDLDVGREVVVTGISTGQQGDGDQVKAKVLGAETLLASQLPGSGAVTKGEGEGEGQAKALLLRYDLDGLVFSCLGATSSWKHASTLPATAYVLASKRDARRVHVDLDFVPEGGGGNKGEAITARATLLAFESAVGSLGSAAWSTGKGHGAEAGNLYVYYAPPRPSSGDEEGVQSTRADEEEEGHAFKKRRTKGSTHAKSRVLRIGGDEATVGEGVGRRSGILLGVALLRSSTAGGGTEKVLTCLCENGIVLITGVL